MRTLIAVAAVAALAFATPVNAAAFTASGSFLVGSPVDYAAIDACGNPDSEGIGSSCVALPSGLSGLAYSVTASDATGIILDVAPAFYDADGSFMEIGGATGTVPEGAASMAIAALGGVDVAWSLTIG